MPIQRSAGRHHRAIIALHWVSMSLIVFGFATVLIRDTLDDAMLRRLLLALHRGAGALLLLLVCVRLIVRLRVTAPDADLSPRLRLLSTLTHWLIYGLMLSIPILGWLLANAHGQIVAIAGVIPLPTLLDKDRDLADQLVEWHENLAWGLLALVALHAFAALWHHYRCRDGVLASMLPLARRRTA